MLQAYNLWLPVRGLLLQSWASRIRWAASSVQGRLNIVGWCIKRLVLLETIGTCIVALAVGSLALSVILTSRGCCGTEHNRGGITWGQWNRSLWRRMVRFLEWSVLMFIQGSRALYADTCEIGCLGLFWKFTNLNLIWTEIRCSLNCGYLCITVLIKWGNSTVIHWILTTC